MKSIGLFGAITLCLSLAQPALAQNEYRQSYTAEKEHGTFIAYLKTRPQNAGQSTSNGFITDVELGLKWTGLLGQPVESYTLKWEAGDRYRFFHEDRNEYVYVHRDDLRAYPDLLAQYDGIKPTDIVLEFWLEADAPDGSEPPRPNEYNNYGAFNKGALGRREVRRTPHLVIDRAGCRSSDIAPSSPRSYNEFVQWKRSQSSGTDVETASKNTMNSAETIEFKDLTIKSVELPNYKFKNIYDELQRRQAIPDDPVAAARKAEADAFWGDQRPDASGKKVVSVAQAEPCREPPRFVAEEKYEIKYEGGLYSVVTPDGRYLIEPTGKEIVSYSNGAAKAKSYSNEDWAEISSDQNSSRCERQSESTNIFGGTDRRSVYAGLTLWVEGSIGKKGEWLSTPSKHAILIRHLRYCSSGKIQALENRANTIGAELEYYD